MVIGGARRRALMAIAAALLFAPGASAGAPATAAAAECEGDECQGPAPAPEEIIPGTAVVEGPPNPPVRFPKAQHHKKHRYRKHHHNRQGKR
jgi:hypothetical protein